ncbi:hypothetical protein [Campylobacter sp. RM16191]|uniref:hypothetical protein n=1 Tax=Campylobacter sp. RM16191 TaxID=1705728 RepID=UPI001472C575|nr:hypothetical protein [Campylobacter sp. RM16191]
MKYITICVNWQNRIYTVGDADVEKKINDFVRDSWASVHYLSVKTNRGETLKLQFDGERTIKPLPSYLEGDVSGEITEVGESFTGKVYPNRVLHYL